MRQTIAIPFVRANTLAGALTGALLCAIFFSQHALSDEIPPADAPEKEQGVSLMGLLEEWRYPGAKFHGAESSDATVKDISSIKSTAVLTTPDAAEKVLAFYQDKLKVDARGKNLGEKPGERLTTKRSVSIQDNSAGRPLKLYILAVNETGSATTVVISRAVGEETTKIAWSNFRRLWP